MKSWHQLAKLARRHPDKQSGSQHTLVVEISWAIALLRCEYFPCFQAFRFPFGAPGLVPPCIRQRLLGIGRARQVWPDLVFAPQYRRQSMCLGYFRGDASNWKV